MMRSLLILKPDSVGELTPFKNKQSRSQGATLLSLTQLPWNPKGILLGIFT